MGHLRAKASANTLPADPNAPHGGPGYQGPLNDPVYKMATWRHEMGAPTPFADKRGWWDTPPNAAAAVPGASPPKTLGTGLMPPPSHGGTPLGSFLGFGGQQGFDQSGQPAFSPFDGGQEMGGFANLRRLLGLDGY